MDKKGAFVAVSYAIILGSVAYFSGNSISTAADINAKELYMIHCKTCHGEDGKPTDLGLGLEARDFTSPEWQAQTSDEKIIKQINDGTPEKMFPFKEKLSQEEIKALVPIVRGFGKK
ncbi:MAG: cytochrome c [Candidatus Jettenia sp.]|nr:cytochrome c [Candidatus Jettenia sp.]